MMFSLELSLKSRSKNRMLMYSKTIQLKQSSVNTKIKSLDRFGSSKIESSSTVLKYSVKPWQVLKVMTLLEAIRTKLSIYSEDTVIILLSIIGKLSAIFWFSNTIPKYITQDNDDNNANTDKINPIATLNIFLTQKQVNLSFLHMINITYYFDAGTQYVFW